MVPPPKWVTPSIPGIIVPTLLFLVQSCNLGFGFCTFRQYFSKSRVKRETLESDLANLRQSDDDQSRRLKSQKTYEINDSSTMER